MYSVLIAEDELLVRMGLAGSVDWGALGLRIVAESSDGLIAMEQYERWKPDIVFTDIRMPGMDGLTLIREIRKRDKRCEIIVITCIEDFKVLHAAMEMGISGYLLKATMKQEDIAAAVRQAVANLNGREDGRDDGRSSDAALFADALQDYLVGGRGTWEALQDRFSGQARLRTPPAHMLCAFIRQRGGEAGLVSSSVQRMIGERLGNIDYIPLNAGEKLIFLLYEENEAKLSELIGSVLELGKYIETNLNAELRFILCALRRDYREIPAAIRACDLWKDERFFCDEAPVTLDEANRLVHRRFQTWIEGLRASVWRMGYLRPSSQTEYGEIVGRLEDAVGTDRARFEDALSALVMFLGHTFKPFTPAEYEMYRRFVSGADTLSQTIGAFNQLIKAPEHGGGAHRREIGSVIDYMQAHPEQDITLPRVAAMVNLSPNYFSQLFKDETGMSFTEYLANVRLEYAKSLLRSGHLGLQEVVTRCGFSDAAYFCRFFKRRTGMSPGQWRKSK